MINKCSLKSPPLSSGLPILFSSAAFAQEPTAQAPAAEPAECFESREGYTTVQKEEVKPGLPNVKCSKTTGGVLWWGDPYYGTQNMGPMPIEADYTHEEAVVKRGRNSSNILMPCTTRHNGVMVPYPGTRTCAPAMHQTSSRIRST
jgi:hypothetical protein